MFAFTMLDVSTVLPDSEPIAYGVNEPLNVIVAVPFLRGLASFVGRIEAFGTVKVIPLVPAPSASAPSSGVLLDKVNDVDPVPLSEAVSSKSPAVMESDAVPFPLEISWPAASATVNVMALDAVVVIPPTARPVAPNATSALLRELISPRLVGNIQVFGG